MSARIFSGVCFAQSSVFCVFVIFCQPLNICLLAMLYLYIYNIYCKYIDPLRLITNQGISHFVV